MEGSCPDPSESTKPPAPRRPEDARKEAGGGTEAGRAPGRRRERRGAEAGGAAGGGGGDGRCAQARLVSLCTHDFQHTRGCTHSWARSLQHTAPTAHTLAHTHSDSPHSQHCPPQTHMFSTICSHSPAAPGPVPAPAQPQPPAQSQVRTRDRLLCPSHPCADSGPTEARGTDPREMPNCTHVPCSHSGAEQGVDLRANVCPHVCWPVLVHVYTHVS